MACHCFLKWTTRCHVLPVFIDSDFLSVQWDLVCGGWQGSPILETGVGFRRQVTDDMNPVVGCHYFYQARSYLPAAEDHCPFAGTKLYCLVMETCANNLPTLHLAVQWLGFEPTTC